MNKHFVGKDKPTDVLSFPNSGISQLRAFLGSHRGKQP